MKTILKLLLLLIPAMAFSQGRLVLVDTLRAPWMNGSPMTISSGVATQKLAPYYGLSFRSGAWGSPIYMDTSKMVGGKLHFIARSNKIRTVALSLSGDDLGAMGAWTFRSDTNWQTIEIRWTSLNPNARRVNSVMWQNNGPDSLIFMVRDVRFIDRTLPVFTPPPAPMVILRFLNDGDTITSPGNLIIGASIHDSLPITAVTLKLDSVELPYTTFHPYRIVYNDIGSNGYIYVHALISVDSIAPGRHVVWISASNPSATMQAPATFFVKRISGMTPADSVRIWKASQATVPDVITVSVPKPKP